MNTLQARWELQSILQQQIEGFMIENNISPSMMDDALSKVLLSIREKVIQEFLIAAQTASSNQTEDAKEELDEQQNNQGIPQ